MVSRANELHYLSEDYDINIQFIGAFDKTVRKHSKLCVHVLPRLRELNALPLSFSLYYTPIL